MSKQGLVSFSGVVLECLPGARFIVQLEGMQHQVTAYTCGKIRKNHIRVIPGDRVTVEMSPQDITSARITFREK